MEKPFKAIEEQIEILRGRNLIIDDFGFAKKMLSRETYYNLINGYKDIFLCPNSKEEKFQDEIHFEHIVNLYLFDKSLRIHILSTLQEIENIYNANIAYLYSEKYGHLESDYLNPNNFKSCYFNKINKLYQRDIMLQEFKTICKRDSDPIKYYRTKYQNVPPWILVKGMSFGNLCNLHQLSKSDIKIEMISRVYQIDASEITEHTKEFFRKSMDIFRRFRNWAAHGSRIFNHQTREELPFSKELYNQFDITKDMFVKGIGKNDFYTLSIAIAKFYSTDKERLISYISTLNQMFDEYKKTDPINYVKVRDTMNLPLDFDMKFLLLLEEK
ncbi:Abi family protein [Sporosarcina sp. FA15]|uniref:Abi family protein n=1 Tax=Sporosarcina sp. FA15 TaxID=3413031 RepID=UPI003F656DCC